MKHYTPTTFSRESPWQVANSTAELDCREREAPQVGQQFVIQGHKQVIVQVDLIKPPQYREFGFMATHRIHFRPIE